jgi:ribosomal protein S18 acetylase RimI-like enzyme
MAYLRIMTSAEFSDFKLDVSKRYAKERVLSDDCSDAQANTDADNVLDGLLPDGVATDDNHLLVIVETNADLVVGTVWAQIRLRNLKKTAHILDLHIFETYRRKGYGRLAMQLVEQRLFSEGVMKITLHVFGHNTSAIQLYQNLGFQAHSISMTKTLQ